MKHILFVLSLLLIGACKKDTPPDSEEKKIELENHWVYPVPEGEIPVWVHIKDNLVIYLTQEENSSSRKLAACYVFTLDGQLMYSHKITLFIDYLPSSFNVYVKGDWISIGGMFANRFINYKTGDNILKINDLDLIGDKSFNYFLAENNKVYFSKYSPSNHVLLHRLDLVSKTEEIVDTLAHEYTYGYPMRNRIVDIIETFGSLEYKTFIYNRLVLGKVSEGVENYIDINSYSNTNQSFLTSKESSEMIDFNKRRKSISKKVIIDDNKMYFSIESGLYAFDLLTRKVIWKINFSYEVFNNLTLINNKLVLTLHDIAAVFLIDCKTGKQEWASDIGVYYTFQMGYYNGYLVVPSNGNSGTPHMTINFIDFNKGGTVYKTTSPHPTEATPLSPFNMQLMPSVAVQDDILFSGDGKNFMALRIKIIE